MAEEEFEPFPPCSDPMWYPARMSQNAGKLVRIRFHWSHQQQIEWWLQSYRAIGFTWILPIEVLCPQHGK